MFVGRGIGKFGDRRVNHLRAEFEEGYWAARNARAVRLSLDNLRRSTSGQERLLEEVGAIIGRSVGGSERLS